MQAILLGIIGLCAAMATAGGTVSQGELRIEGPSVEKLVLGPGESRDPARPRPPVVLEKERLKPPILLPTGTYVVQEVDLKGGLYHHGYRETLEIRSEKPRSVRLGEGMRLLTEAERKGDLVRIDCRILDDGDRAYRTADTPQSRPRWSVSQQGQVIASGTFEYG